MKFSTLTIAAMMAAPVVGFTVTMSSVAYLDRISTGGGLTSFAPSTPATYGAPAPASYSPASYGAPAPAPAPYVSPFANLPASSDINYIKNIGGGNAMKPGKNYSGVSRKFSASSGLPYAPASPSTTMQSPPAPAPAPYVSSFAAAPATSSTDYMGSIGGGNQMKPGKNYSGVSGKWGPTRSTSYEPPAAAPAPYVSSFSAPVETSSSGPANYMSSLGGGSAMKSGKNYSGVSSKFGPTRSNSYLDTVTASSPVVASPSAAGVASGPINYMSSLGGGSAMKSGKNYSGVSRSFGPTKSNSYLDQVAQASPVVSSGPVSSSSAGVASGPVTYMSSLGGGSAMKSGKNYSGVSRSFGPTKSNSYLDQVAQASPVTSSYAPAAPQAAGVSSGPLNYMSSLGGGGAMKSGKNYSGVSRTFGATKSNSYLDQVAQAAPITNTYAPAATSAAPANVAPVTNSLNYMSSLGGSGQMKAGKNYSGVNSKWGPTKSSNSYLDQVKNTVMQPSSYTPAAPAAAPATTYTSYSQPAPASVPALNYMASLSGSTNVATTTKKNYSGFGSTFGSAKSGNSYLESVKNGAVQMAPSSYSAPPAVGGNYLENIGGGGAVSSSYNSMQNSFAAATGQASYQQQLQQQQPQPAQTTGSYLSSL